MKILFSLGAVAALALTSQPASADPHHGWNHGQRVSKARHARNQARRARYGVGHRFNRGYRYTSYNALPRTYVTRYRLSPRYRYVYTNGYIYQVDPTTYAVTRVLNALGL
jgi:hypothetical protein